MSQCPLCHSPVKDDFGLQECNSCGAQLLVHMDGHVEYKGADEVLAVDEVHATVARIQPPPSEVPEENLDDEPPALPVDLVPPQGSSASFQLPEEDALIEEESGTEEIAVDQSSAPQDDSDKTVFAPEGTSFDFDTPPDHIEEEATPPPAVYTSATSNASPDLSDIARFGNSEISGGRDGTLRYNLIIEGIDTADVREAFREAITDRKFVWDIDQILRSVRNGKVQIHNVAPTKGYILISRLRGLPLRIRWEQYAIQQT